MSANRLAIAMLLSLGAPVKPELDLDAEEPPVWDDMLFGDVVDVTFPEVKSQPSLKPDLIDFVDDMPCWNSSPAAKESKRTLRAKRRQARLEAFLRKHDFTEIDSPGVAGLWPIHAAALLGDAKLLRVLMVRGADPDQKTSEGLTPLDYAREKDVEGSHDEVIHLLECRVKMVTMRQFKEMVTKKLQRSFSKMRVEL